MQHSLTDLIRSLMPEDGSSIGNWAMIARLRVSKGAESPQSQVKRYVFHPG